MKTAFIGLGIMGSRMASHLLDKGIEMSVYNRSADKAEALGEKGARIAVSVREAVQHADIVFSMLAAPEAVEAVFFGAENALSHMKKNAIWADCSTVHPSFSLRSAEEAEKYGIRFADIPVAGSKPQAENSELVFFAGGAEGTITELTPYLNMMGRKVLHIGDTGKGTAFKMVVNMMLAQAMLSFSEGVLLGESMGISREFLLDVLPGLVVAAPFTKFKAETIKSDRYDVQFPLELMHKDLHLARVSAYEHDQPLFLANIAEALFAQAKKDGLGRLDFSAIYRWLEQRK